MNLAKELRKLAVEVQTEGLPQRLQAERIHEMAAQLEGGASPAYSLILAALNYGTAAIDLTTKAAAGNEDMWELELEFVWARLNLEAAAIQLFAEAPRDEEEE